MTEEDNTRGPVIHLATVAARALQENNLLREAMRRASAELKCPAAEYVPAMPAAWIILDNALGI